MQASFELQAPKVEAPQWQPAPAPTAWTPEPAPSPAPVPAPAPKVDLDGALRDSGLVLIETRADRVRASAPEAEAPQAPRPRRERRPPPPDLNVPMMQVETHDKSEGDAPPR
jgi:ribonuclease E